MLDEPFAGLDPIAVDALAALMHELCDAGTTVLLVARREVAVRTRSTAYRLTTVSAADQAGSK